MAAVIALGVIWRDCSNHDYDDVFVLLLFIIAALHAGQVVPWMWGINAYATVIGSVLSVLLAIKGGFSFVFILSALIYVLGASGMLRVMKEGQKTHA